MVATHSTCDCDVHIVRQELQPTGSAVAYVEVVMVTQQGSDHIRSAGYPPAVKQGMGVQGPFMHSRKLRTTFKAS
eukprot:1145802-Pelagomonas_calceolata.AAC.6